jgi:hypothetical protein
MITGYNQDVQSGTETLHVQTEDKGREKALIETLVYRGGTIVAAKRTSYADQLANGGIEDVEIAAMIKKQHQIIVAILKAGKIEELIRASQRAAVKDDGAEPVAVAPPEPAAEPPLAPPFVVPEGPVPASQRTTRPFVSAPPPSYTPPPEPFVMPLDDPFPAPAPAAANGASPDLDAAGHAVMRRVTGTLPGELDLDKIISDYLQSGMQKERLQLRLLGRSEFVAGDTIHLQVQATRGSGHPIEGASVVVKVIGTAFKPQIFPSRTPADGVASFTITLPTFTAGSAAVVVQASSKYGDGEIKHLIRRR